MADSAHTGLPAQGRLQFAGRRALVTGSGSGIGRAIALTLAAHGADVCVLDVAAEKASSTATAIEQLGRQAVVVLHDTGRDEVVDVLQQVQSRTDFGPFDLVVNNAGISPKTPEGRKRMLWETSPVEWRSVIDIDVNGYFLVMQAVLPQMIERRTGAIVNISSLAGLRYTSIAGAAYAVAKCAVVGLTRQAAGELAEFGVRVNGIAPGRIETEMAAQAGASFNENIRQSTPLRRLGMPEDVAEAALFLLSDAASFITGETLVVSGGRGL